LIRTDFSVNYANYYWRYRVINTKIRKVGCVVADILMGTVILDDNKDKGLQFKIPYGEGPTKAASVH
jgi:hypothetical protein